MRSQAHVNKNPVTAAKQIARGFQGLQGPGIGEQGVRGERGYQGDHGVQGVQGLQGVRGDRGLQGYQGWQGVGVQGSQGYQGSFGHQGQQGYQGKGLQGLLGMQGCQGYQGEKGIQGCQGVQGCQGHLGDMGERGQQGTQGPIGQGLMGHQGQKGDKGQQGCQGPKGEQGMQGRDATGAGVASEIWYAQVFPTTQSMPKGSSGLTNVILHHGITGKAHQLLEVEACIVFKSSIQHHRLQINVGATPVLSHDFQTDESYLHLRAIVLSPSTTQQRVHLFVNGRSVPSTRESAEDLLNVENLSIIHTLRNVDFDAHAEAETTVEYAYLRKL